MAVSQTLCFQKKGTSLANKTIQNRNSSKLQRPSEFYRSLDNDFQLNVKRFIANNTIY